jgi:hypothetical protein
LKAVGDLLRGKFGKSEGLASSMEEKVIAEILREKSIDENGGDTGMKGLVKLEDYSD